jgi:predicted kinase
MKRLIILRGLPGSGKSTVAKELQGGVPTRVICSADDFFVHDGVYKFDAKLLRAAHEYCRNKAFAAMISRMSVVIIDNTNTQKWEYKDYIQFATEHGYKVETIKVGNLTDLDLYYSRNVHGVPREALERMAARFEE